MSPISCETTPPRIEARGVTVRFGGLVALYKVDLRVPPASIVGLAGPDGAGKSTLLDVLSGLLRPTSGAVLMNGHDVTKASTQHRARRGLARTRRHPEHFPDLTVRERVVLGDRTRYARHRVVTDLVTVGGFRAAPTEEDVRVDEILATLNLSGLAHEPVAGLPLGTSRLVEIAGALSDEPNVVLLDEPSAGLDARERDELAATLARVVSDHDVSLLLVEHDVELVAGLSDVVNVIDFGIKICEGAPAAVRADSAVRAAYLGEQADAEAAQAGPAAPR